jgi:outer membrane protein
MEPKKEMSMLKSAKGLFLVLAGVLALALGSAKAEELRVGTVDMQKAIQSVEAGKKAKSQKEEADIKKMSEEFRKQSLALNDEARARKQSELQERIMKFQELTARSQQEIAQKEQELTQPIVSGLRKIISELAKQKGYSVILEKNENTVLFSQEKDDLTQDVISAYNKSGKG